MIKDMHSKSLKTCLYPIMFDCVEVKLSEILNSSQVFSLTMCLIGQY